MNNVKFLTDELVRGLKASEVPTPAEQNKLEVRILSFVATALFINGLIGPITYVFQVAPSMLYRVATISHGPGVVGGAFIFALLLAIPHAVCLAFFPDKLGVRWPRRLATWGALIAALIWGYLAVQSLTLDIDPLFWLYIRQAIEAAAVSLVYAVSLNSQLLRVLHKILSHET